MVQFILEIAPLRKLNKDENENKTMDLLQYQDREA